MMKEIFTFPFVFLAHKNNNGYRGVYLAQMYFCSLTIMTHVQKLYNLQAPN